MAAKTTAGRANKVDEVGDIVEAPMFATLTHNKGPVMMEGKPQQDQLEWIEQQLQQ